MIYAGKHRPSKRQEIDYTIAEIMAPVLLMVDVYKHVSHVSFLMSMFSQKKKLINANLKSHSFIMHSVTMGNRLCPTYS